MPASFEAVFTSLDSACSGCHAPEGTDAKAESAPKFFASDAAGTYKEFKVMGYQEANTPLTSKGVHDGPALTAEQKAAIAAWRSDEGG